MTTDARQWLELTREDPIDPQLPIIDPHHHLWDYPTSRYLLEDILADTGGGHNVVRTVFVECLSKYRPAGPPEMRPVGETEFVEAIAAASESGKYGPTRVAAGIVGFADLTLGDAVAPVLAAHIEAGGGHFRGIRHAAAWHADESIANAHTHPPQGLLADPAFRRGFAQLQRHGLSFDTWIYHTQLKELADLARAFPQTQIILDHVGTPLGLGPYAGRRAAVFQDWKKDIPEVAACGNVAVKLGGLAMKVCGFDWHKAQNPPSSQMLAATMTPYFEYCIEQFGARRCMFESNFPVDKVSCGYTVLWNGFKRMTRSFSDEERAALFHDTAARVYRLEP
ncbi:MAG: amidohydrolase family protein [Desulfatitalea sp.]|nr:amidohydrolase family protein [Desulfatitalea sp.]